MSVRRMYGVDSHGIGKPATTTAFDFDEESYAWLSEHPQSDTTYIRLLCVQLDNFSAPDSLASTFEVPLPQSVVESAIWKPEVYHSLTCNPSGGASGLVDEPWRFILQTPIDGGPFCSFALSRQGNIVKGVYFFDNRILDPFKIADNDSSLSAWRMSGLQIVTLPHGFLQVHSAEVSRRLASTITKVRNVEKDLAVSEHEQSAIDIRSLSRTLHSCNLELVDLERRSRFEQSVVDAIETIIAASRHEKSPWSSLSPQRTALASRQFDFESLPRRIENARATISGLVQQRNEALNLELTQASHAIAEATLSDARSMKTIAILTMALLPGTAVASLFSMNMFNWSASDGGRIASKWLWIYFVVTIPLTGLILALWWFWNRRSLQSAAASMSMMRSTPDTFRDEEAGSDPAQPVDSDPDEFK